MSVLTTADPIDGNYIIHEFRDFRHTHDLHKGSRARTQSSNRAVPTEDSGRRRKRLRISQATTVAIPPESLVDLTQRDVSGSDTPSLQRNAPRPTRRSTLVGVRPGSIMHCAEPTSGAEMSEVASEFEDEGSNASGEENAEVPIVEEVPPVRPSVRVQRALFELLDQWNLSELFSQRASVMRTIPRFLWGSFRIAMKVPLEEITIGLQARNDHQQERGWKFLALPRMFLHRSP